MVFNNNFNIFALICKKINNWGWLSRKAYKSGSQYATEAEVLGRIKRSWVAISLNYINKFYDSQRMYDLVHY